MPPLYSDGRQMTRVANIPGSFSVSLWGLKCAPSSYSSSLYKLALTETSGSQPSSLPIVSSRPSTISGHRGFRSSKSSGLSSHVFRTFSSTMVSLPLPNGGLWQTFDYLLGLVVDKREGDSSNTGNRQACGNIARHLSQCREGAKRLEGGQGLLEGQLDVIYMCVSDTSDTVIGKAPVAIALAWVAQCNDLEMKDRDASGGTRANDVMASMLQTASASTSHPSLLEPLSPFSLILTSLYSQLPSSWHISSHYALHPSEAA